MAPLNATPPVLAALVTSLSPAERARARHYRFARDAQRFSAARGWLRHVLAARLELAPPAVGLSEGPGKPHLLRAPEGGVSDGTFMPDQRPTRSSLSFSVSRSAALALIAVAEVPIGVDMEHTDAGRERIDAATLACTPAERADLERRPPDEQAQAFLCSWTAKEAFLKGTGQGLAVVAPARIHVGTQWAEAPVRVLLGEEPCAPDTGAPAGERRRPSGWWARHLRPAPDYVAAVAAEGSNWAVNLRSTAELEVAIEGAWRP